MSDSLSMQCPTCEEQALETLKFPQGVLQRCTNCLFFWVGVKTLAALSEDRTSFNALIDESKTLLLPTARFCPVCYQKLHHGRIKSRQLILTECPVCQALWIDFPTLNQLDPTLERTLKSALEYGPLPDAAVEAPPPAPSRLSTEDDKGMSRLFRGMAHVFDRMADKAAGKPEGPKPIAKKVAPTQTKIEKQNDKPIRPTELKSKEPLEPETSAAGESTSAEASPPTLAPQPVPEPPVEAAAFKTGEPLVSGPAPTVKNEPEDPSTTPETSPLAASVPTPSEPEGVQPPLAPLPAPDIIKTPELVPEEPAIPSVDVLKIAPIDPVAEPPADTPEPRIPIAKESDVVSPQAPAGLPQVPPPSASDRLTPEEEVRKQLFEQTLPRVKAAVLKTDEPKPIVKASAIPVPQPRSRPGLFSRLATFFKPSGKSVKPKPAAIAPVAHMEPAPITEPTIPPTPEGGVVGTVDPEIKPTSAPEPVAIPSAPTPEPPPLEEPKEVVVKKVPAEPKPVPMKKAKEPKKPKEPKVRGPRVPMLDRVFGWTPRVLPIVVFLLNLTKGPDFDAGTAMVEALLAWAVAYLARVVRQYPFKAFEDRTVGELLERPGLSRWRGYPVRVTGRLIDGVRVADDTGQIPLNRYSAIDILPKLFAISNLKKIEAEPVVIQGWLRGAPEPFIDISDLRAGSMTRKALVRGLRWACGVVVVLITALILLSD